MRERVKGTLEFKVPFKSWLPDAEFQTYFVSTKKKYVKNVIKKLHKIRVESKIVFIYYETGQLF